MDYDKKIQEHRESIAKLMELKQKEKLEKCPDIIGKYFKLAVSTIVRVKNIVYYHEDEYQTVDAEYLSVWVHTDQTEAKIDTEHDGRLELTQECTKEEFDKHFVKAMQIITSQL